MNPGFLSLAESLRDIELLERVLLERGISKSNLLLIAATPIVARSASDAGFFTDDRLIWEFFDADAHDDLDNQAWAWSRMLLGRYRSSACEALIPRVANTLRHLLACSMVITEARRRYPNAMLVPLPGSPKPYVPSGPYPQNDATMSGALNHILRIQTTKTAGIRHLIRVAPLAARYLLRHLLATARRFLGFWISKHDIPVSFLLPPRHGNPNDNATSQPGNGPICVLSHPDFKRTFCSDDFAAQLVNQNFVFANPDAETRESFVKIGYSETIVKSRGAMREIPYICFRMAVLIRRFHIGLQLFFCNNPPLPDRVAALFFLTHSALWQTSELFHGKSLLKAASKEFGITGVTTSDVDTPDVRIIFSEANRSGIQTISWPHGYYLYQRKPDFYLARHILAHGTIERDFAVKAGIHSDRISMIGRMNGAMLPTMTSFREGPEIAFIMSTSPTWSAGPVWWIETAIHDMIQRLANHRHRIVIKFHPMSGIDSYWHDAFPKDKFPDIEFTNTSWPDARLKLLKGAVFIGHPGSSLIALTEAEVPCIVIPFSSNDKELFSSYDFCCDNTQTAAIKLMDYLSGAASFSLYQESARLFISNVCDTNNPPSSLLATWCAAAARN